MAQPIMVGCDLHDRTMLLKIARGLEKPQTLSVKNTAGSRQQMITKLKAIADGAEVIFVYEASGQGFGLHDELTAAGITCFVLAPTKIVRSTQQKRQKTDEKDAEDLLELLRAHQLAGNRLPKVWIPDMQTRDDRELVRARLDLADKLTAVKTQIKGLLKRHGLTRPENAAKGHDAWVPTPSWRGAGRCNSELVPGMWRHIGEPAASIGIIGPGDGMFGSRTRDAGGVPSLRDGHGRVGEAQGCRCADGPGVSHRGRRFGPIRESPSDLSATWGWASSAVTRAASAAIGKVTSHGKARRACGGCCARRLGLAFAATVLRESRISGRFRRSTPIARRSPWRGHASVGGADVASRKECHSLQNARSHSPPGSLLRSSWVRACAPQASRLACW